MSQQPLWHENIEQALSTLVDAMGGFKRVGAEMWPTMSADEAGRRLADCLNPARSHKLALSELCWLLAKGRGIENHIAMAFLNEHAGYAPPVTIEPEDEFQKSQRLFARSVEHLTELAQKLEQQRQLITELRSNVRQLPPRRAAWSA